MKKVKFNRRNFIARLLAFPFVFGIMVVSHSIFVLKRMCLYMLYGGEYVNFENNERDSIAGIIEMLKEIKENQNKSDL